MQEVTLALKLGDLGGRSVRGRDFIGPEKAEPQTGRQKNSKIQGRTSKWLRNEWYPVPLEAAQREN